jgi:ketosteroid isomerase-like protein
MTTQEVAEKLVQLCREGKNMDAVNELYADDVVSHEMPGSPDEVAEGKDAVIEKHHKWFSSVEEVHGAEISDPQVSGNFFSVGMMMDVTYKEHGRMPMNELAVYEVKDGKIVSDRFFYNM